MGKTPLTYEERARIIRLRKQGVTINQIAFITGRSPRTVIRVTATIPMEEHYIETNNYMYRLLRRIWNWKPPEEQRVLLRDKQQKKRWRKPTNFHTPYSYPRLWEQERREREN